MKTPEEIRTAIERQKKLCAAENLPHFAPTDGQCYDCCLNIYQDYTREGWTGLEYVTGCPHCNHSFCE